jgi:hypothetical protein
MSCALRSVQAQAVWVEGRHWGKLRLMPGSTMAVGGSISCSRTQTAPREPLLK